MLKINKLKLNIKKTKYMVIGPRNHVGEGETVCIDGEKFESVTKIK